MLNVAVTLSSIQFIIYLHTYCVCVHLYSIQYTYIYRETESEREKLPEVVEEKTSVLRWHIEIRRRKTEQNNKKEQFRN